MGWFDQFLTPGGGGLPPSGPPPDDSPDWYWDGSAWTKRSDEGNGGQPTTPPAGPPAGPPPSTTTPPPSGVAGAVAGAIGGSSGWGWNPGTAPAGWDPQKWADQKHQTDKYKVGRILAKYPPTVDGLKQAIPELKAAYPDLTFDGKDGIIIPSLGGKKIDVLQGAGNGGVAWQWIDTNVEEPGGPYLGNPGNPGVTPVGPGPVPSGGAGGGAFGGGGAAGEWTMPRGSEYQFGGVPGYSSGYQSGAFGTTLGGTPTRLPMDPRSSTTAGATDLSLPGHGAEGVMQRGGMTTDQAPSGAFGTGILPTRSPYDTPAMDSAPGVSAFSTPTRLGGPTQGGMDQAAPTGLSDPTRLPPTQGGGAFGSGMTTTDAAPAGYIGGTPTRGFMDTGQGGHTAGAPPHPAGRPSGGYDHAPSFTPLDPFRPPDSPEAAQYGGGTASEKFVLPTGQAALDADPGYQFRLDQGLKSLQNSASARGLLRTGGTLKDIQDFGQKAASQEYQSAVDRAMQVAGFNEGTRRFDNDFGLRTTGFNADQQQQRYQNRYTGANQGYAYANQQNLAGNAQALEGYKTDVGRDLALRGIRLTENQNAMLNSMKAQEQQWMQMYMMNGQSFDQAYKMMMARLQYPA